MRHYSTQIARDSRWRIFLLMPLLLSIAVFGRGAEAGAKPNDVDYYTCTMHTFVRSQDPNGKCPICHMDLVPVMKRGASTNHMEGTSGITPSGMEGEEQPGEFTVPIERQQQIGVTYAEIEKRPLNFSIRTVGTVAYDKQRHWDYVARIDGYVNKLYVFSPGEPVEKGAPLLTLYSPDLLTTENEFVDLLKAQDEANAKGGQTILTQNTGQLVESAKQRLRLWNLTDDQIAELEKTRKPEESLTLFSPFNGVVQTLGVDQGRKVVTGDHLVDIADLSVVWVWGQFYEDELPMLKKDLPITITSSSYPEAQFKGKISLIDPFINEATRTVRVRIDVKNPDFKLRPEMYVNVDLPMDLGEGLAVPFEAVLPTGKHNIVFVDKGGGKLEPRFVEIGRKCGDFYQVLSGLKEHDRVVTSANFLIDAEANVQGALKSW